MLMHEPNIAENLLDNLLRCILSDYDIRIQCFGTELFDCNPTKERGPKTLYELYGRIIIYLYKIINLIK